jgi:fumarate hydratase class II
MNVNDVPANRATQLLAMSWARNSRSSQSSSDTFSIAMNIAAVTLLDERLNPRSTD